MSSHTPNIINIQCHNVSPSTPGLSGIFSFHFSKKMSHMHDPSPRTCHKFQQTHPPPSDHSNNIWQGKQKKKFTVQFYPLSCHFLPLKNRKFVPIHVTKAYRASRGMAPLILSLGNLPPRRESYLLDKRLGRSQIRSRHTGEGKNILPLHILELWIVQPVP